MAYTTNHPSTESLRRELLRNDRLRWMCGLDPAKTAKDAAPAPWLYTRFLKKLIGHQDQSSRRLWRGRARETSLLFWRRLCARRWGACLTARTEASRHAESYVRVLSHNLMIL